MGDSGVTPKGSSLSCPGPAVLTAFPVWEMQLLKCLGLNGFAQANSGVSCSRLTTLVLSLTTMVGFSCLFAAGCRRGRGPCGSAGTSINQ